MPNKSEKTNWVNWFCRSSIMKTSSLGLSNRLTTIQIHPRKIRNCLMPKIKTGSVFPYNRMDLQSNIRWYWSPSRYWITSTSWTPNMPTAQYNQEDMGCQRLNCLEKSSSGILNIFFNTLKKIITNSPVLAYHELKLPIRVTTDASKAGLGAVFEQNHEGDWKPIASRQQSHDSVWAALHTDRKGNTCHSVCLWAISWLYLWKASHSEIRSQADQSNFHQATQQSSSKNTEVPVIRLQKYDLQVNFTPRSEIPMADTLSRAYLTKDLKPEIPEQLEIRCHVHSIPFHSIPFHSIPFHSIIKSLSTSEAKLEERNCKGWKPPEA